MFRMIHNNFVTVVIIADAGRHLPFQIEGYYPLSFCYAHYSVVYQFLNYQKRENGIILESSGCYYLYLNCSDESHTTVDTDDSHLMPGLIFVCPGDHQSCTWEKCTHWIIVSFSGQDCKKRCKKRNCNLLNCWLLLIVRNSNTFLVYMLEINS